MLVSFCTNASFVDVYMCAPYMRFKCIYSWNCSTAVNVAANFNIFRLLLLSFPLQMSAVFAKKCEHLMRNLVLYRIFAREKNCSERMRMWEKFLMSQSNGRHNQQVIRWSEIYPKIYWREEVVVIFSCSTMHTWAK